MESVHCCVASLPQGCQAVGRRGYLHPDAQLCVAVGQLITAACPLRQQQEHNRDRQEGRSPAKAAAAAAAGAQHTQLHPPPPANLGPPML